MDSTSLQVLENGLDVLDPGVSNLLALECQVNTMAFKIVADGVDAMVRYFESMVVENQLGPQSVNMSQCSSTTLDLETILECLLGLSTIALALATGENRILTLTLMKTVGEKCSEL